MSYHTYDTDIWGAVGIEPTTSPTQTENHTTRPSFLGG